MSCLLILFLFGSVLVGTPAWEISQGDLGKTAECGEIFFKTGFRGEKMPIKDGELFPDFHGIYSEPGVVSEGEGAEVSNEISQTVEGHKNCSGFSFKVMKGCELVASPLLFLRGDRYIFTEDVDDITSDWLVPRSLSCECPQICRCEETKLRRSECGRAYVTEDCTKCKATFTALKKTGGSSKDREEFPTVWSSQLTSIILREGCNASLQFLDEDGLHHTFFTNDKVTKDLANHGTLKRYSCNCDDAAYQPSVRSGANLDYPPSVSVPRTKGAINFLLAKRKDLNEHPGLIAALQSVRSKRSSRSAYILLLGMSGSGKSSTVNLLFDHPNITKVGDFVSTTKDIIQFTIPVPIPSLGLNNTALHVIDTPGIGDTSGIAEDARFLATLDQYLASNTDLRWNFPNVVLIFYNFNSNRFSGEGSSFVKMLRSIELFKDKLIDKRSTNVIFVLTHFMTATKERQRDPSKRIAEFRQVIQEHTSLPRPIHIVLAENKPDESLLNVNGFWKLPNNDYYPKNLFDQMERSMESCRDPLGQAIIQAGFSNSEEFNITGKRYPLVEASNEKVTTYLGLLGALFKPVAETEVSLALQHAYGGIDFRLKRRYPKEIISLQRYFYTRGIWTLDKLPKTAIGVVKLLEEVQQNPMTKELLQTAFDINTPEYSESLVVGSGYSVQEDKPLSGIVFQESNFAENDNFMYKIPKMYTVVLDNTIDNQFQVATSRKDYFAKRLQSLGLTEEIQTSFDTTSRSTLMPGFNLISLEGSNETISWNSLSAVVNCITFKVGVNDEAKLAPEFVQDLEQLQPLNVTSQESVQLWKRFFDRYGTHMVSSAFGGGSITITATLNNNSVTTDNTKFGLLSATLANITHQLGNELIGKDGQFKAPEGVHYEFSQRGGNSKHFWTNFTDLDQVKNVELWRESLKYEPVILPSRLQVVPISKLVTAYKVKGGLQLEKWIEEAASILLNASLKYVGVDRIDSGPDSRDRTGRSNSDYQQMQQFAMMFRMISESNRETQRELMQFMANTEKKNQRARQEWEEKMATSKLEAVRHERELAEEERFERELQLKRERMQTERELQERAMKEQLEETRRKNDLQAMMDMQRRQSEGDIAMINFINAENQRRDILIRNNRSFWSKLGDWILDKVTFGFAG